MRVSTLAAALLLLLSPRAHAGAIEDVEQSRIARVGTAVFAPYVMHDRRGELTGYEIEIFRAICRDLKVECRFVTPAWSGILPALYAKNVDFISGMMVTPERLEVVDFTAPYLTTGMTILARRGASLTPETMNEASVRLAVRSGSSAETFAAKRWPRATLKRYEEDALAASDVLFGRADLMVATQPWPELIAAEYKEQLEVLPFMLEAQDEAIPVRKGDKSTLAWLNRWIAARRADGWIQKQQEYWFRSTAWQER